MTYLKRIIREAHRRSIWQVLAIYLAGSWVALQVVDALTRTAGLPDWVPPFAIVLLLLGLPVVLATAIVQEGTPGPARAATGSVGPGDAAPEDDVDTASPRPSAGPHTDSFLERHLTWKRALLGGVAAFALLGIAVGGYFMMRVAGIGPVASLVAQGALEEGEPIVLAEFRNATNDPLLGSVVTEALRIDLSSSPIISLVPDRQIRGALLRMERDHEALLDAELAREVAVREGLKAVLDGEIGAAGSGFILTATLRAAATGEPLAAFRRTARGEDDLIGAIDGLSQDVRERVGESLRAIRRAPPLSEVTTSSLDALQRYTEAERLHDRGDEMGAIALLEQAVALDPDFGMAWRKLSVALVNLGIDEERMVEAAERAYGLRERLSEEERYHAEAYYYHRIADDRESAQRAYENLLRIDPTEPAALNNLAVFYTADRRYDRAEELLRRSTADREAASGVAFQNLVNNQARQGKLEGALDVLAAFEETFPEDPRLAQSAFWVHAISGDFEAADRVVGDLADDRDLGPRRALGNRLLAASLVAQGRLAEAERRYEELFSLVRSEPGAEYRERGIGISAVTVSIRDPARVLPLIDELMGSDLESEIPPENRRYDRYAVAFLEFEDLERMRDVLARWDRVPREFFPPDALGTPTFYRTWLEVGRNDPERMLEALTELGEELNCPLELNCFGDWRPRFLEAAGRIDEALSAWQAIRGGPVPHLTWRLTLAPRIHHETGRVAELAGDTALAVEAYQAFIDLWSEADPELQPRVQAARERVAALSSSN